jgi:hypothetical protein
MAATFVSRLVGGAPDASAPSGSRRRRRRDRTHRSGKSGAPSPSVSPWSPPRPLKAWLPIRVNARVPEALRSGSMPDRSMVSRPLRKPATVSAAAPSPPLAREAKTDAPAPWAPASPSPPWRPGRKAAQACALQAPCGPRSRPQPFRVHRIKTIKIWIEPSIIFIGLDFRNNTLPRFQLCIYCFS